MNVGQSDKNYWHIVLSAGLITILCFTLGFALQMGPTDDAYITYRHAENFARGHGLVFNPGTPVEGTSNFLFALLLGVLCVLKISPVWGSSLINHASLFAIAYLLLKDLSSRLQTAGRTPVLAHISLGFLVLSPSMFFFVWVGLETPFYTALLFVACLRVLDGAARARKTAPSDNKPVLSRLDTWSSRESRRPLIISGLFLGLAAATRMEAVIALPAFAVLLVSECGPRRSLIPLVLVCFSFLLVFVPVFVYRWSFYGYPFPNTYYAKVDGGTLGLLLRGIKYFVLFANMYAIYFVVLLLVVLRAFMSGPDRSRALFIIALCGMQILYVIYVGGDFFPYMRFFVPVFPIVALGFGDIVSFGARGYPQASLSKRSHLYRMAQVSLIAGFIVVSGIHALLQPNHFILAASQQFSVKKRSAVGRMLQRNVPDDLSILVGAAGAIPYYSKLKSYDAFGLTDPVLAHKSMKLGPGRPGHEKIDILGQIKRYHPDLILFYSLKTEFAARAHPGEVEANFYFLVDEFKKYYGEFDEYVPLRLEGPLAVAMVTAKASVIHRLGPNFAVVPPPDVVKESPALEEPYEEWPIIEEVAGTASVVSQEGSVSSLTR